MRDHQRDKEKEKKPEERVKVSYCLVLRQCDNSVREIGCVVDQDV